MSLFIQPIPFSLQKVMGEESEKVVELKNDMIYYTADYIIIYWI